ncbi:MAG TPA: phenylalanine--tRNA ligase subunit alpha [Phycisphaerales bacterium]|nr:phenylalanine--tRNA ligase subunit alpha [Phycisphaerales bacterium]HCD32842.1 phenylalanine--tRNA ligase subunit alpha [Phycisphaerales bacterium]|tara:strand:+ start:123 stop:1133 length:1011 start_codon:yes stop_codon:yes gene_type:complete
MLDKIEQLDQQSAADLAAVNSAEDLEQFRIKYLGTKGAVKGLMGLLKDVPKEIKPQFGQQANALRQKLQGAFDQCKASLGDTGKAKKKASTIDVTEPGVPASLGREHVITQTIDDLLEVFGRMGFDAVTGPEVEDEYHNFVALNIPKQHPARDPLDNFYLDDPYASDNPHLLRSQTSTVQIRTMENNEPPIRVVSIGRVYRPDEHDATHYSMFHQIEGLYVDKKVNMVDLKTTLVQFAKAMFGDDAEIDLVPSYFPFTEPSAELYIKMQVRDKMEWIEIGGCGMVDPNVFKAVGYDPEEWTGFAFGLGIERVAMRKYGITDIRWLFENDTRFLKQL